MTRVEKGWVWGVSTSCRCLLLFSLSSTTNSTKEEVRKEKPSSMRIERELPSSLAPANENCNIEQLARSDVTKELEIKILV